MGPMHALTRMMASIGPTKNQITPFTSVEIQQLEFNVNITTMMMTPNWMTPLKQTAIKNVKVNSTETY